MNLSKFFNYLIVLFLIGGFAFAQTIHQVAEGDSTLAAAIADAADGDIIELITDGGLYTNPNKIKFDKSLVIRGNENLTTQPVIKYNGESTSAAMFTLIGSPRVVFKNLEFDGDGVSEGGAGNAKYAIIMDNDDILGTMSLFVDNCDFHDFSDKTIKPYADCGMDSLVVTNSVVHNTDEGIFTSSGSSSDPPVILDYAEISNCTFYSITGGEAIKGDTYPDIQIVVDHCTFYDVGGSSKAFIYIDDALDVVVKNSVFQKNLETGNFIRLEGSSNFVMNSVVWDVNDWEIDNATVTDTIHADPLYLDPDNADFTLQDGSPAIGFADDGLSAGDARWDPLAALPTVHQIEAGLNTISDAIAAAEDGDIIELTTSGGAYDFDINSDKVIIDKTLEIRAREGLAQKPTVRNIRAGSSSVRIFEVAAGGNLICRGINFDGADDSGAPYAKNVVRNSDVAQADSFAISYIKFYDCNLSNVTQNLMKGHEFTRIDTVIFNNCIFTNTGREAIYLREGTDRVTDVGYMEVTNCTFTDIGREAIYHNTSHTVVRIDHCTFDDIANDAGGTDRALYLADVQDAQVSNSIFSNHNDATDVVKLYGNSSITYCDTFNVGGPIALNDVSTASNILNADPMYIDAANQDYTLASSSALRGAGSDGEAMGDLRWAVDPNSKKVTLITVGNGIVTMDPPGGIYLPGTSVTLTAIADYEWEFEGWAGISVFPPDQNPTTITVNDDIEVTATFRSLREQFTLTTEVIGLGTIEVLPEPNDNGKYDEGTELTVTGVPAENWEFVEWLGDTSSTDNPITFSIDSNVTVTGSFRSTFPQTTLTVETVGMGSVTVDPLPILGTYDINTIVKLYAEPEPGWKFKAWTGDVTSTSLVANINMSSDKNVTATFEELYVSGGVLPIDSKWDLKDAVDFANNNSSVSALQLTTSGGLYTSHSTSGVYITSPLTIFAKEGLAVKPVLTNSDPNESLLDILRAFDDLTLQDVVLDGGVDETHGMKYAVRLRHTTGDSVKTGAMMTFINVDFQNLYQGKKITSDGHAFKIDVDIVAGDILFEGCTFTNIGYEAIRISDTEKWATDKCFESLTVQNCSFTNIDAEGVRYYSDLDPLTPDSPVLLEHLTFNGSGTRTIYAKNSGGAIARDIIISNSINSPHGRNSDLMDVQGNTGTPSYVSYIDTFNVMPVAIKSTDGEVDESTIWGADPRYEDADNMNYTLLASSHMYGLAHDGSALGDLNWATNTPTHVFLNVTTVGNGVVELDPAPSALSYDPGTQVIMTAVADSGYMFVEWSGAVTGSDNPVNVTVNDDMDVQALFDIGTGVDELEIPKEYSLAQNYPNPFNPSTTIKFGLPMQATVNLRVYNILGEQVTELLRDQDMSAGYHSLDWKAKGMDGAQLSSGLYIYRLEASGLNGQKFIRSMKMMLLK